MSTKKKLLDEKKKLEETIESETGKFTRRYNAAKNTFDENVDAAFVKDKPKLNLPPKTTAEQDTVTLRQARINLIWEIGQITIAVMITASVIYCIINRIPADVLNNAFFLVVSMYYIRTNHTKQGGVGVKDPGQSRSTEPEA